MSLFNIPNAKKGELELASLVYACTCCLHGALKRLNKGGGRTVQFRWSQTHKDESDKLS